MYTLAENERRQIDVGGMLVNGQTAELHKEQIPPPAPFGMNLLSISHLQVGERATDTLKVISFGPGSDAGVLSAAIKKVISDGRNVTAESLVRKKEHLINKEASFIKLGSMLVGHCKNENLATGKTTHSLSLGRFGLREALGINR